MIRVDKMSRADAIMTGKGLEVTDAIIGSTGSLPVTSEITPLSDQRQSQPKQHSGIHPGNLIIEHDAPGPR